MLPPHKSQNKWPHMTVFLNSLLQKANPYIILSTYILLFEKIHNRKFTNNHSLPYSFLQFVSRFLLHFNYIMLSLQYLYLLLRILFYFFLSFFFFHCSITYKYIFLRLFPYYRVVFHSSFTFGYCFIFYSPLKAILL